MGSVQNDKFNLSNQSARIQHNCLPRWSCHVNQYIRDFFRERDISPIASIEAGIK